MIEGVRAALRGALLAVILGVTLADAVGAPTPIPARARHRLLVISIDGLDWRYLANADVLGLHIPTLRRFMAEGDVADGVLGEYPTLTWPSHTTLVTGVPPRDHGIL